MKKDCELIQNQLSSYIDGMLTVEESETVRKHLAVCSECQKEHDFMCAIVKKAKDLPVICADDALHKAIMQRVLQTKKPVVKRFGGRKLWQTASALVGAAAVLVISIISFNSLPSHPDLTIENPAMVTPVTDASANGKPTGEVTPKTRALPAQETTVTAQTTPEEPVYEEPSSYARTPRNIEAEEKTLIFYFAPDAVLEAAEKLSAYTKDGEGYLIPTEELDAVLVQLKAQNGYLRNEGEFAEQTEKTNVKLVLKAE